MPATYSHRVANNNALVPASGVPSAPLALAILSVADDSIELVWKNADSRETELEIEYRDGSDSWTALDTLAAGTETYEDTGLSANTARGYRVRAVNGAGNSEWSNVAVGATSESGSLLHTTGNWQKVLRAWLDTFIESDFDVSLDTISDTTFTGLTDEEVWQAWYVMENRQVYAPSTTGFRRASEHFLLSSIEDTTIKMRVGRGGFVDPIPTAFYAFWDHPLNVQYDRPAIYARALVGVAVDMIEARYLHDTNVSYRRADYVGGWLIKWTLPFWMYENHPGSAMTVIDENTRAAFREGIRRMWDNILAYDAGGNGGGDLEAFQLRAMPYLYDLGIITLEEYKDRANRVISEIVNPRGGKGFYHDHGGGTETGIDLGYEGIWFTMLSNAAVSEHFLVPGVTILKDALRAVLDFMAHTTVVDYSPNVSNGWLGEINSASHFNTGTPGGVGFQFEAPMRNWHAAFLVDEFKFQLFGWNRFVNFIAQKDVTTRSTMINTFGLNYSVALGWNNAAATNNGVQANSDASADWNFLYFTDTMPMLAIHGVSGLYTELKAVLDADDDENLLLPPVLRSYDYAKNYGHLVAGKFGDLFTVVHNGPVVTSWAGNPSAMRGGVSSFWIKDRGTFILGVGTGGQDNVPDTWSTHDTWAVNTVSGTTSGGQFSEARYTSQGRSLNSVDPISKTIVINDATDTSILFKKGDRIAVEDWGTGNIYQFTLAIDATHSGGLTTLVVNEIVTDIDILPYGGRVYTTYVETGDDYFIQETRTLIDSSDSTASSTTNSATVSDVVVKRTIRADASGTRVDVQIKSPGTTVTTDVWEQIPAYQGKTGDTYDIEYWDGEDWATLSTTYVRTKWIRLTRDPQAGNVYAYIVFDNIESVKLSSARVAKGIDNGDFTRNIKINIADTLIPTLREIGYVLQADDPS
jgi:hypothetical protein